MTDEELAWFKGAESAMQSLTRMVAALAAALRVDPDDLPDLITQLCMGHAATWGTLKGDYAQDEFLELAKQEFARAKRVAAEDEAENGPFDAESETRGPSSQGPRNRH